MKYTEVFLVKESKEEKVLYTRSEFKIYLHKIFEWDCDLNEQFAYFLDDNYTVEEMYNVQDDEKEDIVDAFLEHVIDLIERDLYNDCEDRFEYFATLEVKGV